MTYVEISNKQHETCPREMQKTSGGFQIDPKTTLKKGEKDEIDYHYSETKIHHLETGCASRAPPHSILIAKASIQKTATAKGSQAAPTELNTQEWSYFCVRKKAPRNWAHFSSGEMAE